jgi:hypothetical protein
LLKASDASNIEYASQIILNSSNTFFAALLTLRSELLGLESCEQLQLWEAGTGKAVWSWRHVTSDLPEPSFGPDGRYFCFYDGQNLRVVDTVLCSFKKTQIIISLLSESVISTDLADFEWNLRNHGLRSFAISNDATRVALAVLDPDLREIQLHHEENRSDDLVQHVDQISIPASAHGGRNKITLRYIASTHALFAVWENHKGVIVEAFDPATGQQLCHVEYPWTRARDWDDPIQVYGTDEIQSVTTEDCIVLSVPAKVHRKRAGGRFLPTIPGRKVVAISVRGRQTAEFKAFSGKSSTQPHDIILSNEQGVLFCHWSKEGILLEKWRKGAFRKTGLSNAYAPRLHGRNYRCAFRGAILTMFSPQGDIKLIEMAE